MTKNKTQRKKPLGKSRKTYANTTQKEFNKFLHNSHAKRRNRILYNAAIQLIYNELPESQKKKIKTIIDQRTPLIGT
jgi:hypothetical protein